MAKLLPHRRLAGYGSTWAERRAAAALRFMLSPFVMTLPPCVSASWGAIVFLDGSDGDDSHTSPSWRSSIVLIGMMIPMYQ